MTSPSFFATRRPWSELFNLSSFTRPCTFGEARFLMKRNLNYFRVNYTMIILLILFLSLLWHPISMIVFLAVFIAWFFLYFFRDEPLTVLRRTIDDRAVVCVLSILTIVALVFTDVWLNVLVSVLIGVVFVVVHASFRSIEDLYVDEIDASDDGRLFSFVGGSPNRAGFARI